MPGVGKTCLALEFLHRHQDGYPGGLFWLEADSPERLQAELSTLLLEVDAGLATGLDPEDSAALRRQWARLLADRKKQGAVLWCLNNLWEPSPDSPAPRVAEICPAAEEVDLLVTSRTRFRGDIRPRLQQITVEPLGQAASRSLLNNDLESEQRLTDDEAAEVSAWVGGLPIALEILNAGLDYGSLDRSTVLDRCRSQEALDGLERTFKALEGQVSPGALRGVAETFELSYQTLSDEARAFARMLSLLAPHPIPVLILENLGDDQAGESERAALISRNLVMRGAGSIWGQLHRLMRDFLRQQDGEKDGARSRLVEAVVHVFRFSRDSRNPAHWLELNPYAVHGLALLEQTEAWQESTVSLGTWLGVYLEARGQLARARSLNEQTSRQARSILGEEHPSTLTSMNNLAETLRAQGDLQGARDLEERALEVKKRVLGEEDPSTLTSMNNLAGTLRAQGDLQGARDLQEKVVKAQALLLGEEHPLTLTSMNNLAETLGAQGDLQGARDLQQRELETCRRVLGEEHPDTLTSMNNLAETLRAQGDLQGARDLQQKAFKAQALLLGEEHPSTLTSMNNLAETLRAQGDLQGARDLQQRELETCRRVLGEEDPDTLTSMNNLAGTLRAQGDLQGARDLQETALAGFSLKLGDDHPNTKIVAANLAITLAKLGDLEKARAVWRRSGRPAEELARFLPDADPSPDEDEASG